MPVPESDQIRFLLNVQRLLTEGQFTATYKFALLMALADLSIERGNNSGEPLDLPAAAIAEKFIEYYWRQAVPFLGQGVLSQNTGQQPVVITLLAKARDRHGDNLAMTKRDSRAWRDLVSAITSNIRKMPLHKLQNVGGGSIPFLYDQPRGAAAPATIRLHSGVAFCFRQFHELIAELVRGAWVRWVHQQNLSLIGEKQDLHAFLFGTERSNLGTVRVALQGIQTSCFYCRRSFRVLPVVDPLFRGRSIRWISAITSYWRTQSATHKSATCSRLKITLRRGPNETARVVRNCGQCLIRKACSTIYNQPAALPRGRIPERQPLVD